MSDYCDQIYNSICKRVNNASSTTVVVCARDKLKCSWSNEMTFITPRNTSQYRYRVQDCSEPSTAISVNWHYNRYRYLCRSVADRLTNLCFKHKY